MGLEKHRSVARFLRVKVSVRMSVHAGSFYKIILILPVKSRRRYSFPSQKNIAIKIGEQQRGRGDDRLITSPARDSSRRAAGGLALSRSARRRDRVVVTGRSAGAHAGFPLAFGGVVVAVDSLAHRANFPG